MSSVLVERSAEGVATVTLNDPDRRNSITVEMAERLSTTFAQLDDDPSVNVIVVTGAGPGFCAGADRTTLARADEATLRQVYQSFLTLAAARVPTIAAVNGAAVGAGVNLALACDIRIAAKSALFDTRFMALGVQPGGGASWMLNRAVGTSAAAAMLVFGEPVDGEKAERIGLAWKCVDDEGLADVAQAMATRVATFEPGVAALAKETLQRASTESNHQVVVELEVGRQVQSFENLRARHASRTAPEESPWTSV